MKARLTLFLFLMVSTAFSAMPEVKFSKLGPEETNGKNAGPDYTRFQLLGYLVERFEFPDFESTNLELIKECKIEDYETWDPVRSLGESWRYQPSIANTYKKAYYWDYLGQRVLLYKCSKKNSVTSQF